MRVLLLLLVVLGIALVATNPGPERYEAFVEEVVTQIIRSKAEGLPGGEAAAMFGGLLARDLARQHTVRDNYFLFSIYRMDMRALGLSDEEWRFLGIATRFIELERPDSLE